MLSLCSAGRLQKQVKLLFFLAALFSSLPLFYVSPVNGPVKDLILIVIKNQSSQLLLGGSPISIGVP